MPVDPAIQLFYFDAGGGHASAARALAAVLESEGARTAGARVQPVNLQELLDPLDVLRRLCGIRLQDYYNLLIAREWTFGLGWAARCLRAVIRLRRTAVVAALAAHFERTRPALVISVIPHFNPMIAAALACTLPETAFVLVLTDLADAEPSYWLAGLGTAPGGGPDLVVCGSARAVAQARARGLPPQRILRVSGMILRPGFYADAGPALPRAERRRALGLEPDWPTALILAGGAGSRRMLDIAARIERVAAPLQAIYICGRNPALAASLRSRTARHPRRIEEFVEDVPGYMRLADVFIGKPGPGSLSEAIHMGLPAIVVSNALTMPQERYNADWLEENGLGIKLASWNQLDTAITRLLQPGVLDAYRTRAAARKNRAVFEIAEAVARLLPA